MMKVDVSALRAVHLKKVDVDERAPHQTVHLNLNYSDDAAQEQQTREYFFSAGMDAWYNSLQECTFPSAFVALSREEAKTIVALCEEQLSNSENPNACVAIGEEAATAIPVSLQDLVDRLQALMQSTFPSHSRFFVKLSTRSPKDSRRLFARAAEAFKRRIDAQWDAAAAAAVDQESDAEREKKREQEKENARWVMLTEEVAQASAVRTAAEAISLFLDSERVLEDLKYALEDEKSEWNLTVVVRAWDERITLASEWRGFCWNRRLTCLGQYFHPLFFPELLPHREKIGRDCAALFDNIKDSLPVPNALVDFAWLNGGEEVLLIEVNPLSDCLGSFAASTGLFDYEKDKALIRGEDPAAPLVVRLREAPEESSQLKIKSRLEWRNLVYGYRWNK